MKPSVLNKISFLCGLLILPVVADSQTARQNLPTEISSVKAASKNNKEPNEQAVLMAEQRKTTAVSLLLSLADEARSFRHESLRSSVQARAADALWQAEPERARQLFRRAWETAESVDEAGEKRAEQARRDFLSGKTKIGFVPPPPNLRSEVLRLAAERDRALADEFFAEMNEAEEKKTAENKNPFFDPTSPETATVKRLEIAKYFLENNDVERAVSLAKPALHRATSPGIVFLSSLRRKNALLADQLYAAMLDSTIADPLTDATSISLLSSYVLTPSLLVTVTRNGSLSNQLEDGASAVGISVALRAAFFRAAGQVLLRPLTPADLDRTAAGSDGTYFTIARLLPAVEQFEPELAGQLRQRLMTLSADVSPQIRRGDDPMLRLGFSDNKEAANTFETILEQIEKAATPRERDRLYLRLVRDAAARKDKRAREFAEKIDNRELRSKALAYVDFLSIQEQIKQKNAAEALKLLERAELPRLQRVWALSEIAQIFSRTDSSQAISLLGEALAETRRMEASDPQRAQGLLAIAAKFFEFDRARTWEVMSDAIKAANNAEDFTGEDGQLNARLQSDNLVAVIPVNVPTFNLAPIFTQLAQEDYYQAISLAHNFSGESPRSIARLAIAASLLKSEPAKARKQR